MKRTFSIFLLALVVGFASANAGAQDTSFIAGSGDIALGGSGTVSLTMDNTGNVIAGWSLGICNDTAFLEAIAANSGSGTETSKNGGAPDFNQINLFPEGATQGVVICFTGCASVGDVSGFELLAVDYNGVAEGSTTVDFCNTLGAPPVETVIVVNGASVAPTQNSGAIEVVGVPGPEYVYTAPTEAVTFDGNTGIGSFTAVIAVSETDNSAQGAPFPNPTQGFSMGLSNDSSLLTALTVTETLPFDADFAESNILADGWTIGVVYSFTGANTLAFDAPTDVVSVDYDTVAGGLIGSTDNVVTSLAWSNALGSPPVENVIVVAGASIAPSLEDGTITLEPFSVPGPEFNFTAPSQSVNYDGNTGSASFSTAFSIAEVDNSALGADFPNPSQGFSMGMGNDSAVIEPTAVTATLPFDADFAEGGIFADGWTIGVVYSFTGGNTLAFDSELDVVSVDYSTVAGALTGTDSIDTSLAWTSTLGSPPVDNVVVVNGTSVEPNLVDGTISLQPVFDIPFVRGNCNGDNKVNIADGIWILNELFLQGPSGTCVAACDANEDAKYDAGDAVFIISYRLLDGPMPTAPFPDCGAVGGADCEATSYCP